MTSGLSVATCNIRKEGITPGPSIDQTIDTVSEHLQNVKTSTRFLFYLTITKFFYFI